MGFACIQQNPLQLFEMGFEVFVVWMWVSAMYHDERIGAALGLAKQDVS